MLKHFPPTFGKFVWVPNSPEFKIPVCAKDIFVPFSPIVSNCPKIWWDAFQKIWLGTIFLLTVRWGGAKLNYSQQNSKILCIHII